ncbi:MAG: hypothetical protein ACKPA9_02525, partial [Microcystis sp.]
MKNFDYWKKLHDGNDLAEFNTDSVGQLWLKVKSITRKELLSEFTEKFSLNLTSTRLIEQFEELFLLLQIDPFRAHQKLDIYIREKNTQQLQSLNREALVSELYKLKIFEWGGDYQNSLDKYLVTHYV